MSANPSDLAGTSSEALEDLLSVVYRDLKRLAAARMARESPDHTLQPTALVHEAWLRVAGSATTPFADRRHFFSVAAEAMRRILIESARRKGRLKRGGHAVREDYHESRLEITAPPEEVVAVHEALDALAAKDPTAAELVKLRYLIGMNMDEAANALGLSVRTAERLWTYARAWLGRSIDGQRSMKANPEERTA